MCHLASSVSEIMLIRTRVFELCNGNYRNLSELAQSMGILVSQIYRVRESKRRISEKFIIGAKRSSPNFRLDDRFYLDAEPIPGNLVGTVVTNRFQYIIQLYTSLNLPKARLQDVGNREHLGSGKACLHLSLSFFWLNLV